MATTTTAKSFSIASIMQQDTTEHNFTAHRMERSLSPKANSRNNSISIPFDNNNNNNNLNHHASTIDDSLTSNHKLNAKDLIKSKTKNPSSWEPIDDILLRHLKEIKKMGWKEISQYFDNRTPNACQFRWRRLKSGNLKSNKTALMDVTIFPGEIKILNKNPTLNNSNNTSRKNSIISNPNSENTSTTSTTTTTTKRRRSTKDKINLPFPTNHVQSTTNNNNNNTMMPPPSTNNNVQLAPLNFQTQMINNIRRTSSVGHNIIHNLTDNNEININYTTTNTTTQNEKLGQPHTFSPRSSVSVNQSFMNISNNINTSTNETEKKFIKPRSYSHSVTSYAMTPVKSMSSLNPNENNNTTNNDENIGFIPKVFVRTRRSSSVLIPTSPTSSIHNSQSFNTALNTTLTGTKSRKNSFVNYQRRYSCNNSSTASSSRRSSVIMAPNSMSGSFNNYQLPTSKQRRESIIIRSQKTNNNSNGKPIHNPINLDVPMNSTHLFNHNYSFTDMPIVTERKHSMPWSIQEDQLLLENKFRQLSLPELSILLPNRSEHDIDERLNTLNVQVVSSSINERGVESSSSSNSPTPQPHFKEYVSPIQSPKRSLMLNQQQENIMNTDEYKDHLELGANRSATSISHTSSASSSKEKSPSTFSQSSSPDDSASSVSSISTSNANNIKSHDYINLLRTARQSSNDHSSLPHHQPNDILESNSTFY